MNHHDGENADSVNITVSFEDVLAGRAYLRIPPIGRLILAHWAGAPWSDKDPDAVLHPLQVECVLHNEREKLVHGASRLGKSVLGGCDSIEEMVLPNAKLAVVAQRYEFVGAEWQYLHKGMLNLFRPHAFTRNNFKHTTTYHVYDQDTIWGAKARGYSVEADEGSSLLGKEFTRAVIGEASKVSKDIFEAKLLRALDGSLMKRSGGYVQRETGKLSLYTTPSGFEGCSAAEWLRITKDTRGHPETLHYGAAPYVETVWIREANILENPAYDRAVYEARSRSLSKQAFDEQYRGRMVFKTGRVLHHFDEDHHMAGWPDPGLIRKMRLGVGIDTGAYTALILAGIDPASRIWLLGETYTQQETLDDTLEQFACMLVERLGPVFDIYVANETDEALWDAFNELLPRIDLWSIDPASQHKLDLMGKIDVSLTTPIGLEGGKLELIPSLEVVNSWFHAGRIHVVSDLDDWLEQMRQYVWRTVRAGQRGNARAPAIKEPRKEFDHLVDAMRFILFPLHQAGPLDEAPAPVTVQEAWDRAQRDRLHGPLRDIMRRADSEGGISC